MRPIIAALITALALSFAPPAAQAAPAEQACDPGAFRQHDMAGVYVDPIVMMRVEVFACGGIYVQWDNVYGTHAAAYFTNTRLSGGGVAATVAPASGTPLDGSRRLGVKPAEPGYVQVITLGVYDETYRVYRLRKIS